MRKHLAVLAGVIVILSAVCRAAALAETSNEAASEPAGADNASTSVDDSSVSEIIVTARKRSESLQRVPISITAVNDALIERNNITRIDQVANIAPNVMLAPNGAGAMLVNPYIRGVGYSSSEITEDSPIAISIDGVYVPTPAGNLLDLFDVQQVEVLRGPQGTLQGRNATGGLISVTSARPTGDFGAKLEASYESFDRKKVKTAFEAPLIAGVLSAKLANFFTDGGNFIHNITYGGDRTSGGQHTWGGRLGFLFTPNSDFTAYLVIDYVDDNSPQPPLRLTSHADTRGDEGPPLICTLYGYCSTLGKYETAANYIAPQPSHNGGVALNADWNLGAVTLTSVTGYRIIDEVLNFDDDQTPAVILEVKDRRTIAHAPSQEFRVASNDKGPLSYVAGVYGSIYRTSVWQPAYLGALLAGGTATDPPVLSEGDRQQVAVSYAAFAQLTYHITDQLSATAGGRETWDRKRVDVQPAGEPTSNGHFNADFSKFTTEAGLDYNITQDQMAYLHFTQGYRSGGVNGTPALLSQITTYQPETLNSYEVGYKTQWLERRLTANIDYFYEDYKNILLGALTHDLSGTVSTLVNGRGSKIYGIEFDGNWHVTPELTFTGTFGWLHAKYASQMLDLGGGTVDISTYPRPNSPEFSSYLGADYALPLGANGSVTFSTDVSSKTAYLATTTVPGPNAMQGGYSLLDGSITYRTANDRYTVAVYGQNLTDRYYTQQNETGGGLFMWQEVGRPRTYGVRVGAKF